jgi:hypothetical protein
MGGKYKKILDFLIDQFVAHLKNTPFLRNKKAVFFFLLTVPASYRLETWE